MCWESTSTPTSGWRSLDLAGRPGALVGDTSAASGRRRRRGPALGGRRRRQASRRRRRAVRPPRGRRPRTGGRGPRGAAPGPRRSRPARQLRGQGGAGAGVLSIRSRPPSAATRSASPLSPIRRQRGAADAVVGDPDHERAVAAARRSSATLRWPGVLDGVGQPLAGDEVGGRLEPGANRSAVACTSTGSGARWPGRAGRGRAGVELRRAAGRGRARAAPRSRGDLATAPSRVRRRLARIGRSWCWAWRRARPIDTSRCWAPSCRSRSIRRRSSSAAAAIRARDASTSARSCGAARPAAGRSRSARPAASTTSAGAARSSSMPGDADDPPRVHPAAATGKYSRSAVRHTRTGWPRASTRGSSGCRKNQQLEAGVGRSAQHGVHDLLRLGPAVRAGPPGSPSPPQGVVPRPTEPAVDGVLHASRSEPERRGGEQRRARGDPARVAAGDRAGDDQRRRRTRRPAGR